MIFCYGGGVLFFSRLFFTCLCASSQRCTRADETDSKEKKSETEAAELKRAAHAPYFKAGQPATHIVLGARATRQGLSKVSHRRSLVPAFNESRSESLRPKDAGGARGRRHVTSHADATPKVSCPTRQRKSRACSPHDLNSRWTPTPAHQPPAPRSTWRRATRIHSACPGAAISHSNLFPFPGINGRVFIHSGDASCLSARMTFAPHFHHGCNHFHPSRCFKVSLEFARDKKLYLTIMLSSDNRRSSLS